MNEYERQWIEIITKAYPNLHNQDIVMHTSKESDKKIDRIRKYFERLDEVHQKVAKSHRKSDEDYLKELYYSHYIIKEENIPESYYQSQARMARERGYGNIEITDKIRHNYANQIIEEQKRSLDKWIEYFLYDEESKSYGMWEKYWVFQGIVGLGNYDKVSKKFTKRNITTITTFPNVDREAIFNTIKLMEEYIKDKKSEEEIKIALGSGNFKTLYEFSIKQKLNKGEHKNYGNEGKWIKYNQGSDYNILRDSLQGYYTGWCTAAGETFAKSQIQNGDFYVYYSKDENNETKIPRLAIRMDGHNTIGEIRGIANNQNIEPEMLPILNEKLKEFPDRDKYYKKEEDMKKLTIIDKKANNSIELTMEELRFLYEVDNKIKGFGYEKDPRIQEIKNKRNIKQDYSRIYNIPEDEIAITQDEYFKNVKNKKYKLLIGNLDLRNLTTAEGLELPEKIVGFLDLRNLTTAEGLELPETIGGYLELGNLTSAKDLKLPEEIGGTLYLGNLTTAEDLKFPKTINGSLYLSSLTTAEGLKLPEKIGEDLTLNRLITVKGLELPETIGGSLELIRLAEAEGLEFPKIINGYLKLNSLTSAKGLKLPEEIGGTLDLGSLTTAEGLKLPEKIGRALDLSSLTTVEGLKLPEEIGWYLDLSSLTTAEGLKLPEEIGWYLDLSSLTSAKGLNLPKNYEFNRLLCPVISETKRHQSLYYQDYDDEVEDLEQSYRVR